MPDRPKDLHPKDLPADSQPDPDARPVTPRRARRLRGFEAAGAFLKEPLRTAGEKRGFAVARLLTHWPEIVGPDLAEIARPVRIGYQKGGLGATLTVLTAGASAPILQMQLPKIRDRVNACYGYNAIARVAITQTAPQGFAEAPARFEHAKRKQAPAAPNPALAAKAQASAEGIGDPGLRDALARLAENVLARSPKARPAPTELAPHMPPETDNRPPMKGEDP